jgi:hypothetical protein
MSVMSRCIVLAIPEIIFQRVLLDWLQIVNVARLDRAFCSKKLLSTFLLAAYKDNSVYDVEAIDPLTQHFLWWCMAGPESRTYWITLRSTSQLSSRSFSHSKELI